LICLFAGVGPLAGRLQKQIKEAGLADRIKFVGPISNTPSFLNSLDAFIFPSLWEGQGIVLLEAGLVGLPIIASATGGITDMISADSGFLVPAGDAAALAGKIDWLAANWHNPEIRIKTERLRERIKADFDIKKIAAAYESLYRESLKEKGLYENTASK